MRKRLGWLFLVVLIAGAATVVLLTVLGPYISSPKPTPRTQPGPDVQATIDYLQAKPIPQPIAVDLIPAPGDRITNSLSACVTLHQDAFWQTGVDGDQLQAHLASNTKLFVDKQVIMTPYREISVPAGSGLGGPLEWCFVVNLPDGEHLFSLTTKYLTGQEFSYSWIWIVGRG